MTTFVTCCICNKSFKRLAPSHIATHKITIEQYRCKFPEALTISTESSLATSVVTSKKRRVTHACSDEKRKMLRDSNIAFWNSPAGKEKSKETVEKRLNHDWVEKRYAGITDFQKSDRVKLWGAHISAGKHASGYKAPQNVKDAVSKAQTGRKHSDEEKKKRAASIQRAKDEGRYWDSFQRALKLRPNKFEQRVVALLPEKFQYTGDFNPNGMFRFIDGRNKNADFTLFPERTAVIECFGTYWHSQHFEDLPPEEHTADIVNNYAAIGVTCLVIWEHELRSMDVVKQKVDNFLKYVLPVSKENTHA